MQLSIFPVVNALLFFICLAFFVPTAESSSCVFHEHSFSQGQIYQEICHRFWVLCFSFPGGISARALCPPALACAHCAPCLPPGCGPEISLNYFPWNSLHLYPVLDAVLLGFQSFLSVCLCVSVEVSLGGNFAHLKLR